MSIPYLPLFIDDYEAATAHLSVEEDGCYMRLLRLCWRTPGGSIPDDHDWIRRRMRVDEATYERLVQPILAEFFTSSRGRLCQKRLLEIYNETAGKISAKSKAGKLGGLAKAAKHKEIQSSTSTDLPEANGKQNPGNKEPEPDPEPEKIPPLAPHGGQQLGLLPEVEPAKKSRARPSPFPEDWIPSEKLTLWAISEGLDRQRVMTCARQCVDYSRSRGNTYLDYDAAFRTWIRNEVSRYGPSAKPSSSSAPAGDDTAFMRRLNNRIGSQQ